MKIVKKSCIFRDFPSYCLVCIFVTIYAIVMFLSDLESLSDREAFFRRIASGNIQENTRKIWGIDKENQWKTSYFYGKIAEIQKYQN